MFFFYQIIISLILVIAAFEWRSYDRGAAMDLGSIDDDFEDLMEIPPTEQPPPPPPVIQQPEIIEVPDEEEIEVEIEGKAERFQIGGMVFIPAKEIWKII